MWVGPEVGCRRTRRCKPTKGVRVLGSSKCRRYFRFVPPSCPQPFAVERPSVMRRNMKLIRRSGTALLLCLFVASFTGCASTSKSETQVDAIVVEVESEQSVAMRDAFLSLLKLGYAQVGVIFSTRVGSYPQKSGNRVSHGWEDERRSKQNRLREHFGLLEEAQPSAVVYRASYKTEQAASDQASAAIRGSSVLRLQLGSASRCRRLLAGSYPQRRGPLHG